MRVLKTQTLTLPQACYCVDHIRVSIQTESCFPTAYVQKVMQIMKNHGNAMVTVDDMHWMDTDLMCSMCLKLQQPDVPGDVSQPLNRRGVSGALLL